MHDKLFFALRPSNPPASINPNSIAPGYRITHYQAVPGRGKNPNPAAAPK